MVVDALDRLYPHMWYFKSFNAPWLAYSAVTALVGIVLGAYCNRRGWLSYKRSAPVVVGFLAVATAVAHSLVVWILAVDPNRDFGGIPLPLPGRLFLQAYALTMIFAGHLLAGFVVAHAIATTRRKLGRGLVSSLAIFYSLWVMPWILDITFD